MFDLLLPSVFQLLSQGGPPISESVCTGCGGSAFTPIAAAFSTLGYYAQAGWLEQIVSHGLGSWAMLAYTLAGVGFLISISIGLPPRMYLWFAIGPALFYWLVENRTGLTGVEWRVGNEARDQTEVWKLTEVGLRNESFVILNSIDISSEKAPSGSMGTCGEGACVSDFFAWFDILISDTVRQLINFLGVSRVVFPTSGAETNIITGIDEHSQKWDLTSQKRWEFFASVTGAQIRNNDLRQSFATFMASECGDAFLQSINTRQLTAAANKNSEGAGVPGILKRADGSEVTAMSTIGSSSDYLLWYYLGRAGRIPLPSSIDRLGKDDPGNPIGKESGISELIKTAKIGRSSISCPAYLTILMRGLRWESIQIAYQVINMTPKGVEPTDFVAHMLLGWSLKDSASGEQINAEQALEFIQNLVFAYLFRNEMKLAPNRPSEAPITAGEKSIQNVKDFQVVNGQKSKFGELYTWATMIPYFQGKLLYFLAIAYPFACMLIVVPGMHRVLFQWMQFWIWAKLWDVGFAVVMILERSVWSMTVNATLGSSTNWHILQMGAGIPVTVEPWPPDPATLAPTVTVDTASTEMFKLMADLIDRLLIVSPQLQLDLSNSYYIYIMSALYFSVPAITGQLVLGAKSGAAGMISSAIGQIASPAGSAAGQAAAADLGAKMKMNQSTARQESFAKAMRANNLAANALGKQNESTAENILSSAANTKGNLYGTKAHLEDKAAGIMNSAMGVNRSLATLGGSLVGMPFDRLVGSSNKTGNPGAISSLLSNGGGYLVDRNRHGETIRYNQQGLGHTRDQIGQTQAGFNAQAKASIAGLQGSRAESGASFKAEQAAWESANNYAQSNSDFAAAIGLGAGYLDPGQKPTNLQGMAMDGMLGEPAQSAARDLTYGDGQSVGGIYSFAKSDIDGVAASTIGRTQNPDMSLQPAGGSTWDGSKVGPNISAGVAMTEAAEYSKQLGVEGLAGTKAAEIIGDTDSGK